MPHRSLLHPSKNARENGIPRGLPQGPPLLLKGHLPGAARLHGKWHMPSRPRLSPLHTALLEY